MRWFLIKFTKISNLSDTSWGIHCGHISMLPNFSFTVSGKSGGARDVPADQGGVVLFGEEQVSEINTELGIYVLGFGVEEVFVQRAGFHDAFSGFHGDPKLEVSV